ncbi:hypothetical protein LH462_14550 [Laribacter hongkongensis]|uniref:Uncharacterized protein n=1 Tax=Laribacter hongkongensis TaxID=168471 RepID=A0ABD4SWN3_9NEIS|nr:hypothetical protein [Laribacter hongkongensis]MCG9027467.1 hypothetical protein [Laribacter hongkongensis]MCG9101319.1 hypothetical protein [Laribacter hongkongensis]MCG9104927.1 hypothetical protein [Laribacter hongkongensis]MCG9111896.1 hypothetical protein [Laribacter hongkongensis]MCG9118335.1 hypothetical protein [Laribacter hongkongensis]
MNIEDEITIKAGRRTTKVLVRLSLNGVGGRVLDINNSRQSNIHVPNNF